MKARMGFVCLFGLLCFLMVMGNAASAEGSELVNLLVEKLDITTQQAEGGAGSIFNTAKQNMSSEDFSKVTTAMPEVESLTDAVPKTNKGSGTLGTISSISGSLGKMAGLYDSFSKLGLSKDMVGKFIPYILDYSKSKGGETVYNLLKTALQ